MSKQDGINYFYNEDEGELIIKWNDKLTFKLKHNHYVSDNIFRIPQYLLIIKDDGFSFVTNKKGKSKRFLKIEDIFFRKGGEIIIDYKKEVDCWKGKQMFLANKEEVVELILSDIRKIESQVYLNLLRK